MVNECRGSSIRLIFKNFTQTLLALIYILSILSCSTLPTKTTGRASKQEIEKKAPHNVFVRPINEKETLRKIERFEDALKLRGSNLTKADWQLHDELLSTYIQLKNQIVQGTRIRLPARSRLKIDLSSFCLNSSRASPMEDETFQWIKKDPGLPYYKELLKLSSENEIKQADIQTLLWNLQNKTYWENYPNNLKAILQKIDPKAPLKLPSRIKDTVKDSAIDYLKSQIPLADKVDDAISFAEGEYYKYEDYARSVRDAVSQYPLEKINALTPLPSSSLYSEIRSVGYSKQSITLYNQTHESQEIDLSDYYLQPDRRDVQRIGIAGRPQVTPDLLSRLEKVIYDSMAHLGVGFTPVLGDVADIYELLTGKDFLNGQELTWGERLLSGIGIIAGSGAGYRYAARAAYAPKEFIPKFEREFKQVASKEISLSNRELKDVREFIEKTRTTKHAIQVSPTLRKTFESPNFKKTDFYVRPNGEVIPAKGYRYISSDTEYLSEMTKTGKVPASDTGTYISFKKIDSPATAKSALQLPPQNNASIRLEFDTGQIAGEMRVPRGQYDTADYLEPITRDFPEFGQGGGHQAITHQSFDVSKIVDLKTNKVLFERGGK